MTVQSKAIVDIDNAYSFISHQASSWQATKKYVTNFIYLEIFIREHPRIQINHYHKMENVSVSRFDSAFGFHFVFLIHFA